MTYTIDDLLDQLQQDVSVGDVQAFRVRVINTLRTRLWRRIGYERVGVRFVEPVNLPTNRRIELADSILTITDASLNGADWTAVEGPTDQLGPLHVLTMQRDPYGVTFPYFTGAALYVRGYRLQTDADEQALIPEACFPAAYDLCLAEVLGTQPQHPRFGERSSLQRSADTWIGRARAALTPRGEAADRTIRRYIGYHE
ncbi:hypothetical protein FAES_3299 [Fibrella aestuarina BUZ 2]|uniref:Uncharacterized protein n=1 Tax=Fibrella aestuarina BUZ 2 TaxID=1166018 RepID=I0KB04_9BACT|nr:hypothetical protein [Fibrella aestuarina]CCH01307.1 hypothetical protein FAES_3299 [Fibrella aestuarina BUZ 2]